MINVDIKYPRNKTDNLNSKVTAYAALLNTQTVAPNDALDIVDITSDNAEVVARGEEYWKKKKEEQFEEQQKQLQLQAKMTGANEATQEGGNKDGKPNSTNSSSKQSANSAKSNTTK